MGWGQLKVTYLQGFVIAKVVKLQVSISMGRIGNISNIPDVSVPVPSSPLHSSPDQLSMEGQEGYQKARVHLLAFQCIAVPYRRAFYQLIFRLLRSDFNLIFVELLSFFAQQCENTHFDTRERSAWVVFLHFFGSFCLEAEYLYLRQRTDFGAIPSNGSHSTQGIGPLLSLSQENSYIMFCVRSVASLCPSEARNIIVKK